MNEKTNKSFYKKLLIIVVISIVSILGIKFALSNPYIIFARSFGFSLPKNCEFIDYTYENMPFQEDFFMAKILVDENEIEQIKSDFSKYFSSSQIVDENELGYHFPECIGLEKENIIFEYTKFKQGKYAKTAPSSAYLVLKDGEYYLYVICY